MRGPGRRLEARDLAIAAQTTNLVGREALSGRSFAPLTIENAGDHFIGIKRGQAAQQRNGIFVGPRPHRLEAWNRNIQLGNSAAAPAHCQMRTKFVALERDNNFFKQAAQQFLAISIARGPG